jgi:hypothetical protein
MKVRLFTSVSSAQGSWGPGFRDLPDKLAGELIAGKLACKADDIAAIAKAERAARGKE